MRGQPNKEKAVHRNAPERNGRWRGDVVGGRWSVHRSIVIYPSLRRDHWIRIITTDDT